MVPSKTGNRYDVIVVGRWPGRALRLLVPEQPERAQGPAPGQGPPAPEPQCPAKTAGECVHCRPCNILTGVGGAGLFSDGKLNFLHKLGKTDLTQFMDTVSAEALIRETEAIFNPLRHGRPGLPHGHGQGPGRAQARPR